MSTMISQNYVDNDISEFIENFTSTLDDLKMPLNRYNMDNSKNRYGNLLLNFCKGNSMFIVNGRVGKDQKIGRFTCKNASVVDYCISSSELLKSFTEFDILETSKLYSDVHTPLHIFFSIDKLKSNENQVFHYDSNRRSKAKPWNNEKQTEFNDNIDEEKFNALNQKLDRILEDTVDIENVNTDCLVEELGNIFIASANKTFGSYSNDNKRKIRTTNNNNQKPWFDGECRAARQCFRKAKKLYKTNNSVDNYDKMKENEKKYKKIMDDKYKIYCKRLSDDLQFSYKDNPKHFWKILNKNKRKKQPDIDIDILHDFFKTLNTKDPTAEQLTAPANEFQNDINEDINRYINKNEILYCIKNLKNDKACSEDDIVNEYIKSTSDRFIHVYEKLFNIIFDTGVLPQSWLSGIIKPIYKNKGDKKDPKNYRPITIVSCLGKLFTAILNSRLSDYSEECSIIKENQSGFRQNYSTLENIFSIFTLFQILKTKRKKLYCAFIDFEKAFDRVWRDGLFYKLLLNNINGKMYNIISNMYSNIKSCISYNNNVSDYFNCEIGVRQGENLSPFLFSLFLNDLEDFLLSKNITGLNSINSDLETELEIYLKMFIMLYADDTVLLAETPGDLQLQLNAFGEYCEAWKMKVNVDKTKVLIFGYGRLCQDLNFSYKNADIEIVKQFNYLGVTFTKTCNFDANKKYLADKAIKAMYEVLKLGRAYKLTVKIQLDLFDKLIKPILLYGCEIWGFGKNDVLERVHLKFCKILLNLKSSTPNYMVYGELGRHPIEIDIKVRAISYWARLQGGKESKYANLLYKLSRKLNDRSPVFSWINFIKKILNDCGFPIIWETEIVDGQEFIKNVVKQRLLDQFTQNWFASLNNSTKALNYRIFKEKLEFEEYFNILNLSDSIKICRFRTTNHHLPVETGRWRHIERENRFCHLCNCQKLGDEYHYILECSSLFEKRKQYLPKYFLKRHNIIKFSELIKTKKRSLLHKLCNFIKYINKSIETPG